MAWRACIFINKASFVAIVTGFARFAVRLTNQIVVCTTWALVLLVRSCWSKVAFVCNKCWIYCSGKAIHASWAWDQYLLSLAVVTSPAKFTVRSALSSLKEIEVAIRAPFRANGAWWTVSSLGAYASSDLIYWLRTLRALNAEISWVTVTLGRC